MEMVVSALVTFQRSDSPNGSLYESLGFGSEASLAAALELTATPEVVLAHYAKVRYLLTLTPPSPLDDLCVHPGRAEGILPGKFISQCKHSQQLLTKRPCKYSF